MAENSNFTPGDRISFFGGEGTVVRVEDGLLHIHTSDGEIVEYRPDLPMVSKTASFESGERVSFPGGEGEILKIEQRPGQANLLLVRTDSDDIREIRADRKDLEALAGVEDKITARQFDEPWRFDLVEKAAQLDLAYRFDRFLSLTGNRIDITPHQVEAAHEILNSHDHRYLIGDEVGLGKTIEAGIVIEELLARDRAERVLIVTPASLKMQWQAEMQEKFDQEYVIYDRDYVNAIEQATGGAVWEHDDHVITSIDFAKQDDMLAELEEAEWDIAVFDEAHHLTARRDDKGHKSRTKRYQVGEVVSPNTDALLFLTGTPHNGKSDQFYYMMDLLEPYRFEDETDLSPSKLEDVMIRRLKSNPNMIHSDGSPMFPDKEIDTLSVEFTGAEDQLYQGVTDYLRNGYRLGEEQRSHAAGFSMVIYQKRLVSSIRAIQESLRRRADALRGEGRKALSQLARSLLDQYHERPETLTEEQRQRIETELQEVSTDQDPEQRREELEIVEGLIEQCQSIEVDSKARALSRSVGRLLAEDPDEKVLVFTEYTDTLEYLRDEVLTDHDVAQIHGGMGQVARLEEVERFRNEANVMLATDAAREGLNLQFAHVMINYDLPWNPVRIDQRMGRLHRYGQDQTVNIYNLFVEDTRESKVLERLVTKIDRIEDDLGMSSDVLGMVLDDDDFDLEERIMDATIEQEESGAVTDDIDEIIEERKEAVKKIQDEFLISDQFDESDLDEVREIIEESQQDHIGQEAVRTMVELFFEKFDGSLTQRSEHDEGTLYTVDTPGIIELESDEVRSSYAPATFDQDVAREKPTVTFLSVNHPLVRAIVDYCLDGDWIDGRTTVKIASESSRAPGILCNFRLGHSTADGSDETEEFVQIYVGADRTVALGDDVPEFARALPEAEAEAHPDVAQIAEDIDSLIEEAKQTASQRLDTMVEEAEQETAEAVAIKREHATRYFDSAIETWETRLENYQQKDREGDDMTVNLRNARAKIEELRKERKHEFERLREEEAVYRDTNEIINVAVVV